MGEKMNVHIALHYVNRGNKKMRRGDFKVNPIRYREDPFQEAVRVAKEWINQLVLEEPEMIIQRIVYNQEHDITELVVKRG